MSLKRLVTDSKAFNNTVVLLGVLFFSNIIIREHMFVWRIFWIHGIMNTQKRQARAGTDPRSLHPYSMLLWAKDIYYNQERNKNYIMCLLIKYNDQQNSDFSHSLKQWL